MSSQPSKEPESKQDPADLAQAYRELAKGEQAATALEANLTNLESKLDSMLAALEQNAQSSSTNTNANSASDKSKDNDAK